MSKHQLNPSRFHGAEYKQNVWVVNAPEEVKREDLTRPDFWSHIASQLRRNDEIKVFAEDGSYFAHILVMGADRTWANVRELAFHKLTREDITEAVSDDYDVKLRGPKRWSVIRKSDREVLQENMHTKDDAERWLSHHIANPEAA